MNILLLASIMMITQLFAGFDEEITRIEGQHGSIRIKNLNYFYQSHTSFHLEKEQINKLSKKELSLLIKVFEKIAYYVQNDELMENYEEYFTVLTQNSWETKANIENYYFALINNRNFARAIKLFNESGDISLEPLPEIIDAGNFNPNIPIVYALNLMDTSQLIKENHTFISDPTIIVIAHPLCHFCNYAAHAISQDKELLAFFKLHSNWFSPADGRFKTEPLVNWYKKFPSINLRYINKIKDFPEFASWATPTFYFLKNNQVVGKLQGWPKEGRIDELKQLIKQHFDISF